MNGNEFIKKIKRLGKERGVLVHFETKQGKGSHGTLFYGCNRTTVKDRTKEIGPGLLNGMLQQLGLSKGDI